MSVQKQNPDLAPIDETEETNDAVISRALWWSLAVITCVAVVVAVVVFWPPKESPPAAEGDPPPPARTRQIPPVAIPRLKFTDITKAAGITFVHENGASAEKLLPETMGGGVAFFDFDGDGDPDLLFVSSQRWDDDSGKSVLALYSNDGTGKFTDVSAGSGLNVSMFGMGVAVGDFDNDGFPDVYVTGLHGNRLFRNLGDGTFVDVTPQTGVAGDGKSWSTSAGFFDYDNDGNLDLFVCNYVNWSRDYDIGQSFTLDGTHRAYGQPQRFPGSFCFLFHNNGDGTFSDVSQSAGIQVLSDKKKTPLAKSLGVTFADLDGDGYLEIIVANDTVQNFLFHNHPNAPKTPGVSKTPGVFASRRFVEIGKATNIAFDSNMAARGAMGIDVAHFRNSHELGIAIGNFSNEMTALYVSRNRELQFTDVAIANGIGPVTRNELTFGLFFFDADLDGRLDLFASNGHLERDIAKVQTRQSYQQPPQLLWNCGPGHPTEFLPIVEPVRRPSKAVDRLEKSPPDDVENFRKRMGDFVRPLTGRGAAFADIDGDGDQDLVIVASGQPARLLRNDQQLGHHWLQVKLIGRHSNRSAIGAIAVLKLDDGTTRRQQVMPTRSYLSQVEPVLTFGLGKTSKIKSLRIQWPTGKIDDVTNAVRVDSRLTFTER